MKHANQIFARPVDQLPQLLMLSPDVTAHTGSVTCVDTHRDNILVATGSVDSSVKIVHANSGKVRRVNNLQLTSFNFLLIIQDATDE